MESFLTKHAHLFFVLGALSILWPALDLVCCQYVMHTAFHYSTMAHLVLPIIFSAIFTLTGMLIMARNMQI